MTVRSAVKRLAEKKRYLEQVGLARKLAGERKGELMLKDAEALEVLFQAIQEQLHDDQI